MRHRRGLAAIGLCALGLSGCAEPSPYTLDAVLRLNHVQAKGTHNSYHVEPESVFDDSHRYTHAPLDVQLGEQGVRQFELDLHWRTGEGFEVFHIPAIDPETTCAVFTDCLLTVRAWSEANRWHLPIVIWFEAKDEADEALDETLGPIAGHYDDIDADIRSVFDEDALFTPADLKGEHPDLPSRLAADGWPTLGELRGRVVFVLLDTGEHRTGYLGGTSGFDRAAFVGTTDPAEPWAAFYKINDGGSEHAAAMVQQGFVVTSNVDGVDTPDDEAQAKADAALANGVHFNSSDLPAPVDGREYWLDLPGGTPARCNPVTAPAECSSLEIEAVGGE